MKFDDNYRRTTCVSHIVFVHIALFVLQTEAHTFSSSQNVISNEPEGTYILHMLLDRMALKKVFNFL